MKSIFTAGHSNIPINKLLGVLKSNGINRVVDVRTRPYSRYSPQYNKANLKLSVTSSNIKYTYMGENLGGLGENYDFKEAIRQVAGYAINERVVLLCSEKDFRNCHRNLLLSPEFIKLGFEVIHLSSDVRERSTSVNPLMLDL